MTDISEDHQYWQNWGIIGCKPNYLTKYGGPHGEDISKHPKLYKSKYPKYLLAIEPDGDDNNGYVKRASDKWKHSIMMNNHPSYKLYRKHGYFPISAFSWKKRGNSKQYLETVDELQDLKSIYGVLTQIESYHAASIHFLFHKHIAINKYWKTELEAGKEQTVKKIGMFQVQKWIRSVPEFEVWKMEQKRKKYEREQKRKKSKKKSKEKKKKKTKKKKKKKKKKTKKKRKKKKNYITDSSDDDEEDEEDNTSDDPDYVVEDNSSDDEDTNEEDNDSASSTERDRLKEFHNAENNYKYMNKSMKTMSPYIKAGTNVQSGSCFMSPVLPQTINMFQGMKIYMLQ